MSRRRKPAGQWADLRPAAEQSPLTERQREVNSRDWRRKAEARTRADREQWAEEALAAAELRNSLIGPVPPGAPPGRWRAKWRKHAIEGQILDQAVRLKAKLIAQGVAALKAELRAAQFARRARHRFMPQFTEWKLSTAQQKIRVRQAASQPRPRTLRRP